MKSVDRPFGPNVIDEPLYRYRRHVFEDRIHAGHLLAKRLRGRVDNEAVVLAIPAGGVPVGYMVAKELKLAFDVAVVRKLHIPWNKEAGFGAIGWDGTVVFNEPLLRLLKLSSEDIERCIAEETGEIDRRIKMFRGEKPFPEIKGRTAVLVDDGLASGYSMLVAVNLVKKRGPNKIIVAVPTSSLSALALISPHADEVVCLNVRDEFFYAVADAYKLWYDLSDEEVFEFLRAAKEDNVTS